MMHIKIEEVANGYIVCDLSECHSGMMGTQHVAESISKLRDIIQTIAISHIKDED